MFALLFGDALLIVKIQFFNFHKSAIYWLLKYTKSSRNNSRPLQFIIGLYYIIIKLFFLQMKRVCIFIFL